MGNLLEKLPEIKKICANQIIMKSSMEVFLYNIEHLLCEIVHSARYVKRDGPAYHSDSLPETQGHFHVKSETIFCEKNTFQVFFPLLVG